MSLLPHQLELLAPARDADIGIEAINHGADAVYIGGPDFGARYWYMMLVPLIALTVRGVMSLSPTLSPTLSSSQPPSTPSPVLSVHTTQLLSAVVLLSVVSLVAFVPWRSIDKYWHYRGMEAIEEVHHVRDLHVTLLRMLGLDDNKLTFYHGGRFKQRGSSQCRHGGGSISRCRRRGIFGHHRHGTQHRRGRLLQHQCISLPAGSICG